MQHQVYIPKTTWYLVDAPTVEEYSHPWYSEHAASIYMLPPGASVPSGTSIILESNANPSWMVANSAINLSDGNRISALNVREEVGLPMDIRFATARDSSRLYLVLD